MTSIRDFTSPEQAGTAPLQQVSSQPTSPASPDNTGRNRRASTASRLSAMSTSTTDGMRRRRAERSNTVRTYHEPEHPNWQPGAEPGIDTSANAERLPAHLSTLKAACAINVIDFSDVRVQHSKADNDNLPTLLATPRPDDLPCRWISINGLSWDVIKYLGNKYGLHKLAIEDLIHTHTRTKVDWYADHAFVVLTLQKLVRLHQHRGKEEKCNCNSHDHDNAHDSDELDEKGLGSPPPARKPPRPSFWSLFREKKDVLPRYLDGNMDGPVDDLIQAHSGTSWETPVKPIRTLHRYENAQIPEHTAFMEKHSALADEDLAVSVEQVSIFLLADNTIISFFEHSAEDVEAPILDRLGSEDTMLRRSCDASLMLQAIIDAIVDLAVPVKDAYNKSRKELQVDAMTNPDIKTSRALHIFGEEVDMLQNLFKPIVHLVNALRDHNTEPGPANAPPPTTLPEEGSDLPPPTSGKPSRQTPRDHQGSPLMMRNVSDYKRKLLKRSRTATTVAITPLAHTYFGDVLDHCITMIQTLEQMDASASNISTLIFNTVGAKTNNFMMILAVVTVFFAPLTFISGYFGMNFASASGLDHPFGFFWVVAIPSLIAFMLIVFATMLWDHIEDWLAKQGIRAHARRRTRRQ